MSPWGPLVKPVSVVLALCAVVAELLAPKIATRLTFSAAFTGAMLAVGFLGPVPAFLIPTVANIAVWVFQRYRWRALVINLAASATPSLLAAVAFDAIDPPRKGAEFVALLVLASVLTMATNVLIVSTLMGLLDGTSIRRNLLAARSVIPAVALNIAIVAVVAEIYAELGLTALVFVLLNIIAFTYMARLVIVARERTREYANLSWGVLSGLIRTLDERDSRAARHCAAVAAFARDIAKQCGMSKRDQELAHTAGLLHDIGKFALSDRVMERGGQLSDPDWRGIRRHPDIGAELLRDIGVYGPVAEIVRTHHERPDGRGYPRRLRGDEIPAIARIVAVAEVYDTLTAPDTYRTPMTSFEALTELRRVAGSQLDATYVEALSELLAGRGTDYRHADEADFDRELDIERRMSEAIAPSP
ncbi:MAG TPA: HD domain-containing phosphohydrolase [Solirubrobacteraceae bacterium]|nr:HD domain-containing phosphohydrolase [Solirubrobacteraceae bacterium]